MKAPIAKSSQTRLLLAILFVVNAVIYGVIITGCAVRGLHLDAEEIQVSPSRGPILYQPQPAAKTNPMPVKAEDPL